MFPLKNIHPLSDFVRNAKARLAKMKKTGEPAILTVNGAAEAVVLSADAYEKLVEEMENQKTNAIAANVLLEMFHSGQITAEELKAQLKTNPNAQSLPAEEAFAQLDKKFQARRRKKAS